MTTPPRSGHPPGSDPLLVPPIGPRPAAESEPSARHTRPGSVRRPGGPPSRRRHPARGARATALTVSVVATGAVAAGLAYSEGAWSADTDPASAGSTDQPSGSPTVVDGTSDPSVAAAPDTITAEGTTPDATTTDATTPDVVAPEGASPTPSTSVTPTTPPATAPPTDVAVEVSGYADGAYLGTSEYTEWGDVQVQVTISNGAIVEVVAVEYPTDRKSRSINGRAVPMLEAQAVALQSAELDVVSGATYTSRTYADSLQAALDQAALAESQETETS